MTPKTVGDWQKVWIESNEKTNGLEVVIKDSNFGSFVPYIYEGSFKDIPKGFLGRRVIQYWKIIEASVPERIGAYNLVIG